MNNKRLSFTLYTIIAIIGFVGLVVRIFIWYPNNLLYVFIGMVTIGGLIAVIKIQEALE